MLRPHQSPGAVAENGPHLLTHELLFQLLGGPLLPSSLRLTGLWILFAGKRAVGQLLPMRDLQASVENCLLALPDRTEASNGVIDFQPDHHALCDCWVPLSDHAKGVELDQCAAGRTRTALSSPSPPAERDKVDRVCAAVDAFGVPRICLRQDHTFSSCRMA